MNQKKTVKAGPISGDDLQSYCPPDLQVPLEQLAVLLYQDLRKIARRERFRMPAGSTFCTTALVNELFVRL